MQEFIMQGGSGYALVTPVLWSQTEPPYSSSIQFHWVSSQTLLATVGDIKRLQRCYLSEDHALKFFRFHSSSRFSLLGYLSQHADMRLDGFSTWGINWVRVHFICNRIVHLCSTLGTMAPSVDANAISYRGDHRQLGRNLIFFFLLTALCVSATS